MRLLNLIGTFIKGIKGMANQIKYKVGFDVEDKSLKSLKNQLL